MVMRDAGRSIFQSRMMDGLPKTGQSKGAPPIPACIRQDRRSPEPRLPRPESTKPNHKGNDKLMARVFAPSLHQALRDADFPLPDECSDVRLSMPADGIYQLHYTINLNDDKLARLARALMKVASQDE